MHHCACMLSRFSHVRFFVTPWSPQGSSVCGVLQARILEWAAMPSSRESSRPREPTSVFYASCIDSRLCTFTSLTSEEIPSSLPSLSLPSVVFITVSVAPFPFFSYHKNALFRAHYPFRPWSHLHYCIYWKVRLFIWSPLPFLYSWCAVELFLAYCAPGPLWKSFKKTIVGHDPVSISWPRDSSICLMKVPGRNEWKGWKRSHF